MQWTTTDGGRDWYDLVWHAAHHPRVNLRHLESRMRQSGDYSREEPLPRTRLLDLLGERVVQLDVAGTRQEVGPYVYDRRSLEVWSQDFFLRLIDRIQAEN